MVVLMVIVVSMVSFLSVPDVVAQQFPGCLFAADVLSGH